MVIANTFTFHKQPSFGKRKKFIRKLVHGDQIATSQEDKHQIQYDYYDGLLGAAMPRSTTLELQAFHRAGIYLSVLDVPFSEVEVWATIKSLLAGTSSLAARQAAMTTDGGSWGDRLDLDAIAVYPTPTRPRS